MHMFLYTHPTRLNWHSFNLIGLSHKRNGISNQKIYSDNYKLPTTVWQHLSGIYQSCTVQSQLSQLLFYLILFMERTSNTPNFNFVILFNGPVLFSIMLALIKYQSTLVCILTYVFALPDDELLWGICRIMKQHHCQIFS